MTGQPKPHRLKFETERLRSGPLTYDLSEPPITFDLVTDPDYIFDEPVQLHLTLTLVGTSVLMRGTIATLAKSPCSRCLEPLRVALSADVSMTFMEDERLLDLDKNPELIDDDTHWFDGEMVYPADQLRELLLLELPINPACELDENDICPLRNVKVASQTFGPEFSEEVEEVIDENSLASQLKRLRDKPGKN